MKRRLTRLMRVLPLAGLLYFGPCGVTTLQWQDFALSTGVRVVSQGITNILEAFLYGNTSNS